MRSRGGGLLIVLFLIEFLILSHWSVDLFPWICIVIIKYGVIYCSYKHGRATLN